jgi:hypothetical protein
VPFNSALGDIAHVIQLAIAPVFLLTAVGRCSACCRDGSAARSIVMCALLICLLIAIAFVDALTSINLSRVVAVLFVLAMLALR